jgi:uncharacterized phiE125 gp8 family phage protein
MLKIKLVTAPIEEPVDLDEVKAQLRVDGTTEDTHLDRLRIAARNYIERTVLNRALVTQTWDCYLQDWPLNNYIEIPLPPLVSITSIKYTDYLGVESTFASTNYMLDIQAEPGRVYLKWDKSWPSVSLQVVNGIVIRFVAGYGAASAVPEDIKQAILLNIGSMYENRENNMVGNFQQLQLAFGSDALLDSYRIRPI